MSPVEEGASNKKREAGACLIDWGRPVRRGMPLCSIELAAHGGAGVDRIRTIVVQTCGKRNMRIGCAALPSGSEYCFADFGHRSALNTQTPQAELSFADAVHQFNIGDRDHCVAELLEPQHHSNALLDA
jgi:hypothetical protein